MSSAAERLRNADGWRIAPDLQVEKPGPIPLSKRPRDVAVAVSTVAMVTLFAVMSQVFFREFNAYPSISVGASLGAGVLGSLTVKALAIPSLRRTGNYLVKYDHLLFQICSIFQNALPNTPRQRMIWFTLIFSLIGYVLSSYLIDKVEPLPEVNEASPLPADSENLQNLNEIRLEERPLPLDGNPRGRKLHFMGKGSLLVLAGTVSAICGKYFNRASPWHLGFVGIGLGIGLPLFQVPYRRLQRKHDLLVKTSTTQRVLQGNPLAKRALDITIAVAPAVGNLGICCLGGTFIALRNPKETFSAASAVLDILVGNLAALLDLSLQDEFQHQETWKESPPLPLMSRAWQDIRNRPGVYLGTATAAIGATGLLIANKLDPSPGSVLAAEIILEGGAITFAATRLVDLLCKPGKRGVVNQINFRVTRSTHLLGLVYTVLLGYYYAGTLQRKELNMMWVDYSALMGILLNQRFREPPNTLSSPSTVFLLEGAVTGIGVMTGRL